MSRRPSVIVPGLALALVSCSSPQPPPDPPPTAPDLREQVATELGVSITSRDATGAPRLITAVIPRASRAGANPELAARDHLAALTPLYLTKTRPSELTTVATQPLRNGSSIVRLTQQIDHVDIHHGELRVMVQADGSLAAVAGTVLATGPRPHYISTADQALDHALDALYGPRRARPAITTHPEVGGHRKLEVASDNVIQVRTARAKRELMPEGGVLVAAWTIEVIGRVPAFDGTRPAARRYIIADSDGRILRDIDLIANDAYVYRAFADGSGARRPFDGALKSYTPHPTGTPDGTLPGRANSNLIVMEAFNKLRDPWLPATATTTSGNNIDAFADIAQPSGFSDGDIRPEVQAGRIFNYRYDFTAGPLANPTQSKAAAVNLFYITNWLHDWYYDSGFTEATGNAQLDNYGRGGVDGDPLIGHAQDDALGGSRDNAFMATPSDGLSPEMHMFLWTGGAVTSLDSPIGTLATANFIQGPTTFDFTGEAVLAANGDVHDACTPITNDIAGKIGMFEFTGGCGSFTAVGNLKAAGAVGVIAMIAAPDAAARNLNGNGNANIPGLVVGFADGNALKAVLPATVTLHRRTNVEADGDFDNAIVAHEWGHYLHHRLAQCEALQCRGMSEGWGDFTALHMMLRPGDNRGGTYGTGLYALTAGGFAAFGFLDPGYFGIRRFPYSVDRTKNALSFRHIGDDAALPAVPTNPGPAGAPNSEVHNAGEVWATMLWEAYNALIDQHSLGSARRRMSDYVVAGLLLTPPDATFTEGRDAILAAARALDGKDMLLMAAAFAGRGAGSCAVGPDRSSSNNAGVIESGDIAANLVVSGVTLRDDGTSCDNDGYLDPGESGMLRLTVANAGVLNATNVNVTARTTTAGITLGKPIKVGKLKPFQRVELAIPVTVASDAAVDGALDITVRIDGDAGCNSAGREIAIHQRLGVDEAAEVATVDHVETAITPWQATGINNEFVWSRARANGNTSWFGLDAPFTSDTQLQSPVMMASATDPLVISLSHAYNFEIGAGSFFDGGVIEVSTDGGTTWRDVSELGVDPQYNAVIESAFDNPLGGRPGYGASNASFPAHETVTLDFGTQLAGLAVQLRFRIGTDVCCSATGWDIDDIAASGITNTPFPGFVPEPTVCTAPLARTASGIVGDEVAPERSLDDADAREVFDGE